ncbi:hypothetical protein CBG55_05125 [Prevotella intermedia]|uniref:Ankyrin repeat domain-containing protein n=1 Tax=Prevotella intermedia TaxID=28131 RepID=A0A2M8TNG9_PREIN|nr:ankyrin repeat domain-containing protein [Prevotella intermedia]OWP33563.1 hypothetical protein CBG55_05125 [Prevotella intermedia]PJI25474.1 ankyrin repeat domain-containing protein [Prevotella intermedia]
MFNNKPSYTSYFSKEEYPIIEAIHNKDKEKLYTLMQRGWNINSTGKGGMTYLEYAVFTDNYKMTEFLLENGADPNLISLVDPNDRYGPEGMLPLSSACHSKHSIKFVKLLIKYGANVNDDRAPLPIFAAALNNDKRKIEYLLEHGADINKLQDGFKTVITDQATVSKWPMVLWLWDKGADPMKTGENETNVAVWVQDAIDGTGLTEDGERVKARLESIGVKFPYRPAKKESAETDK